MDRHERKEKKDRNSELDHPLLKHIESLGLRTVEDYISWCAEHGFSRRTDKHWRQRLKERAHANRAIADARLAQKKQELKKPAKIIERIFSGRMQERNVTQPEMKAVFRAYKSAQESRLSQRAFHELLQHICSCSDLLSSHPVNGQVGNTYVDGLLALARNSRSWIRPVADWKPKTHNTRRQFSSLARHLFAEWPVPVFMDSVWFLGNGKGAVEQQDWFLHVGRGENIRSANLPLPFTKRMAHHFMQAPADCTVAAAMRRGQIHGLGGNERLARAIIGTRLGTEFEHDDFWTTVLQFFIANPMLDLAQIGPIIDFIHHQRFVWQDVIVAPGVVERRGPPQPNFTMKGRTPASLLRQVEAWHRTLAKVEQPKADWPRSGIDAFEFVEGGERGGNLKVWTITELLNTKALVAEGRKMKHCVATYSRSCAGGVCSIWTLEVETFEGHTKILTVEIQNGARLICQARGKCNNTPGEKHRGILRRWAEKAGLRLANHV